MIELQSVGGHTMRRWIFDAHDVLGGAVTETVKGIGLTAIPHGRILEIRGLRLSVDGESPFRGSVMIEVEEAAMNIKLRSLPDREQHTPYDGPSPQDQNRPRYDDWDQSWGE